MNTELKDLKALLHSIPGYVSWIDENLCYLGVNSGLAESHHLQPEDFVGREIGFSGSISSIFVETIRDFFASDNHTAVEIMPIRMPAKIEDTWMSLSLTKYDAGKKMVAIGIDVTALQEAEAIIAEQRLAITTASKLSALGEMAASLTHELASPLTVISGFGDHLQSIINRLPESQVQLDLRAVCSKIQHAANHAGTITASFRRFSRDGSNDAFTQVEVSKLIDDTLILCQEKLRFQCIELRRETMPQDLWTSCRPTQIVQVLLNIINNAVEAIGEGRLDTPAWISLSVKADKTKIYLAVSNSGPDIPADVRGRIMTPFFTTKPPGLGTGIGLSISRRIMLEHNGTLEVMDGMPITFMLTLPRASRGE